MTLQFLKKHPDYDVEKLFFKSPAIRMEKIFELLANGEDMTKYEETPYVTSSGIEVYYELYKEMLNIVITPENIIDKPEIFIYHGTEDELSLLEDVLKYQKDNIHIEVLEGAVHSYRGEYFDRLIELKHQGVSKVKYSDQIINVVNSCLEKYQLDAFKENDNNSLKNKEKANSLLFDSIINDKEETNKTR